MLCYVFDIIMYIGSSILDILSSSAINLWVLSNYDCIKHYDYVKFIINLYKKKKIIKVVF